MNSGIEIQKNISTSNPVPTSDIKSRSVIYVGALDSQDDSVNLDYRSVVEQCLLGSSGKNTQNIQNTNIRQELCDIYIYIYI